MVKIRQARSMDNGKGQETKDAFLRECLIWIYLHSILLVHLSHKALGAGKSTSVFLMVIY